MKLAALSLATAALAACGTARPGTLANDKVDLAAFPARDAQLLFHTAAGARVADLRTHTTFDLGPRGFVVQDITDDGRVVVLVDANRPELVILHDGVERGRVTLPRYPGHLSLHPSGAALGGTYSWMSTAESTDELFHVDTATLELTRVPAQRRGRNIDEVGWTPTGELVVTMDDARLDHREATAATPVPVVAYDPVQGRRMPAELAPADLARTRWNATIYDGDGPATCTTAAGATFPGGWTRLADIRGMVRHPHVGNPVRSWGFLDDCSLHIVHDGTLYLVDTERRAVSLGPVSHIRRPTVFAGNPFH